MHGNDDSLPCSDAVVPPIVASQNSTPSPLEPSTGKSKPCKKESDVWEHFEKYDLALDLKGVDVTKRKEVEKRAKCKYCINISNNTYASDTKKNGTSNILIGTRIRNNACNIFIGTRIRTHDARI
ncbi:unnamed protein product [Prunus brigantina]